MKIKHVWSVAVALLLGWFTLQLPCWAAIEGTTTPAAVASAEMSQAAIEVARIRSGILPGIVIGSHHEGMLGLVRQRYTASGQLGEQTEEAIRRLIEDELIRSGYAAMNSTLDSIFSEQIIDDTEPERFMLGATITQVQLDSYSSLFGDRTTDERTVRWELFDREIGKVAHQSEQTGRAEVEGIDNPAATYEAIRESLQKLLIEPSFLAAIQRPTLAEAPATHGVYQVSAIAPSSQALTVEQLAGRAIPAVVGIQTEDGSGTGFLINDNGLIVTNQHVVGSAFAVKVKLYDGSKQTGRVLKRDGSTDVALVKLDRVPDGVSGLPLCSSNTAKVGESVVAIGHPLALTNTVTQGIISGFRTVSSRNLIQTDTAINPGNSGGPLLNRWGAVVGIVTEKMASRGIEGLGFALPIGDALERLNINVVAGDIVTSGDVVTSGDRTSYGCGYLSMSR